MTLIVDPVSVALDSFIIESGESVLESVLRTAFGQPGRLVLPRTTTLFTDLPTAQQITNQLHKLTADLCSRNSFGRLLILFRKIPLALAVSLFASKWRYVSPGDIGTLAEQAILYGTNAILKYSSRDDALHECNARYKLQPTDTELEDALRLAVYALLHRHMMFYKNTLVRQPMMQEVSFETLLDSYNLRLQKRQAKRFVGAASGARILIVPAFVFNIPMWKRFVSVELAGGESRVIAHRNYFPATKDFDVAVSPYEYLETDTFSSLWSLQYGKWKTLWAVLNSLLRESILTLWTPKEAAQAGLTFATASAERADDYADTGLGMAIKESLVVGCVKILERDFANKTYSHEDVTTFIDGLTMMDTDSLDEVHFVEQPYLFYKVGEGRVIWDYLRHGGILRAVARKTAAAQRKSQAADTSGPGFEVYISNRIREANLQARDIKTKCDDSEL
jgi:hypothetical protein